MEIKGLTIARVGQDIEEQDSHTLLVRMLETSWPFLKTLNIHKTHDPVIVNYIFTQEK
jgi:hypothetical protein